jgi:hypothetical protein
MTTIIEAPQIAVPLQATFLDAVDKGGRGPWTNADTPKTRRKSWNPIRKNIGKQPQLLSAITLYGTTYWSIYSTSGMRKGLLLPR